MNIKCNICGGDVTLNADKTFTTCEYCGSTITVPKISDEQRAAAFNRGNHFRRIGEFDKALASYERILREDDADAEAHWCAALCRFGIEYVEDPATYEYIPTCHRASFDSFTEDVDYLAALEYSDGLTRRLYQKEAAKIAEVQRGILATSQNEEPFDVFLCYKETGEDGQRTRDSILAQDIYYQLTEEGHRVFFARITLEDKAGSQYEPYIFAALNSAKVMVAVGTKPEHFSAVWVKNEWSRFLALMRKDRSRVLLPCYRDMDPYDLPDQLQVLQSYDMGKIGFIQDLIRGVDKVVRAGKTAPVIINHVQEATQIVSSSVTALLDRGYMALEDADWKKADHFFEEALNQNARLAQAYLGKFLAENQAMSLENFTAKYLAQTEKVASVKKEACPRDTEAEDQTVLQYTIPGYFDAITIRGMFNYDRTYTSVINIRQDQYNRAKQLLHHDKILRRTEEFCDDEMRKQIEECRSSILSVMENRLTQAQKAETDTITKITSAYQAHVQNVVYQAVPELHDKKDAIRRKKQAEEEEIRLKKQAEAEANRQAALRAKQLEEKRRQLELVKASYDAASRLMTDATFAYKHAQYDVELEQCIDTLNKAIKKLETAGDYKDSAEKLEKCRLWIAKIERRANGRCRYCGGSFKGLFVKTCSDCGKPKDY